MAQTATPSRPQAAARGTSPELSERGTRRFVLALVIAFTGPTAAYMALFVLPMFTTLLEDRGWVSMGILTFGWTVLAVVLPTGPTRSSRNGAITGLLLGSALYWGLLSWATSL